jgi:hypothetical protein
LGLRLNLWLWLGADLIVLPHPQAQLHEAQQELQRSSLLAHGKALGEASLGLLRTRFPLTLRLRPLRVPDPLPSAYWRLPHLAAMTPCVAHHA